MKIKKTGLVLALALIVQSLTGLCAVSAKSGEEIIRFYDFEDYTASPGDKIFPDSYWSSASGFNGYGSAVDPETGSRVLYGTAGTRPLLFFGELITEGKIHISFDMKTIPKSDGSNGGMIKLVDGRGEGGAMEIIPDSKTGYNDICSNAFNWGSESKISIYYREGYQNGGDDMISWRNNVLPAVDVDHTEWHHYDLVFGDFESKGEAYYYLDGVKMNGNPIYFTGGKGFKGLEFYLSGCGAYIDNVYMHRYFDDTENLHAVINGGKSVPVENTVLDAKFCEKVDPDAITKDNIIIERSIDGYRITDFDIVSKDSGSAKLQLNETLQSGLYSIKFSGLTGLYTGCVMNKSIDFRTEFQSSVVEKSYYSENFNDYTADGNAYPTGWKTDSNDKTTNPAVRSIERSDGNYAFGMQVSKENERRPYFELADEIPKNKEITVEFDVYTDGAQWGFYLLDEHPRNDKKDTERKELIIGGTANDTKLKYASAPMTTCDTAFGDSCVIPTSEWHKVTLKVTPNTSTSTTLTVKADNGTEYTGTMNRGFTEKSIKYIAIGVKGASSAEGSTNVLYIDNLAVKSQGMAYKPEVDQIVLNEYTGEEYKTTESVPEGITDINIKFNTEVEEESAKSKIKLECEGSAVNAVYTLSADKKTMNLKLDTPLKSDKTHKISILKGIEADISSTIKSEVDFIQSFKTQKNDVLYEIYDSSVSSTASGDTFKVKIVKTDGNAKRYTAAVCGYNKVTEDGKTYERMADVQLIPINLKSTDTGYFEFETDALDPSGSFDTVRAYIFEYPSMQLVTVVTK